MGRTNIWVVALELADVVAWTKAFAFTQMVEAPLYRFLVPTRWSLALAASALTHPFVWFALPWLGERLEWSWTLTSILSEVFAVTVEAALFWRIGAASRWRALGVSLLANGASVALGLLVRRTLGIV